MYARMLPWLPHVLRSVCFMRMVEREAGHRVSDRHLQTDGLAYDDSHDSARLITKLTSSYTYAVSD
jgi:hypothetical protein